MKMLPERYMVLNLNGGEAYVRRDKLSQLKRIDSVIFDCDGVLVDIRDSYNKAISETVAYILEGLTGYVLPKRLISEEVIFLFRRSGGFNNDWDTVYGILMFILRWLPEETRSRIQKCIETVGWHPDPFKRFCSIRESVKKGVKPEGLSSKFFEELIEKLKKFTELLDATGTNSVDKNLVEVSGVSEDFVHSYNLFKRFLYHPARVGESIIATVFEEFFCGPKLFQKAYGLKPRFYKGLGMIENEKVIVQTEALDHLITVLGKTNLGIASGSRFESAKYVLGELLERFNPKALVFLDVVEETERSRSCREGLKVNLKKPHPFSLLKAAEAFGPFSFALYVGDSMEDGIMVQEARKIDKRFMFAGVYQHSSLQDYVLRCFLNSGCDIVIPSVNELPLVLEALRKMKR